MKAGSPMHQRVMYYARAEKEKLYSDFQITDDGYNAAQVEENRRKYGSGLWSGYKGDTVLHRLRRAFINPFTVILFVLALISFVTDVILASNFSRDMTTVVIIVCMLLMSGIVRFIQEMRAGRVAEQLTRAFQSAVTVRRDGRWAETSSSELVVGDTVRLCAGERVPADIRLIKANDVFVSQSVITGESAVFAKNDGRLTMEKPRTYGDYKNIVFMGSAMTGGTATGVVLAVGQETVYGGFSGERSGRKNIFDQGANSIAWVLIRFMAILVPIVLIACGLTRDSWLSAFLFALSVAVGLTPEMLPMVINACLAKGSAAMGRKQTIVKNMNAMQGFGSMDVLCIDKTGTLTGDEILLEYYMDILGNECGHVLDMAFLNSLYHTRASNHLDAAILKYQTLPHQEAHFKQLSERYPKLDEHPFDYERRIASVLVKGIEENVLLVKGNIDEVCRRCSRVEYQGKCRVAEPGDFSGVHAIVDEMLEDGMKVLAVAYKTVPQEQIQIENEQDLILSGYLAFFDAPKKTAADAIQKLKKLHVGIKVLTGDQRDVAVSVCRRLGIDTDRVLTGNDLEALADNDWPVRVEKTAIFAELTPGQKAAVVHTLQDNGHIVGFLGDGMNDLSSMIQADVGISVDTAAETVKEGADVILLKKDLNVLEAGILEGRKAFFNMSKYIRITASSNFGNILSIVIASVFLPFFPMTSVQLLLLNLLYDTLCLVLPWDHVDADACARPLEWSGRTLGRFMRTFGPVSSVFDILTFVFLFFAFCPWVCGGSFFDLNVGAQAEFIALFQTGWFLESMWTQILILHMLRTGKIPFLQSRPSVPVMAVTALGVMAFTILTYTPAGTLIGLTALPGVYFIFLAIVVVVYLMLMTLVKRWYVRKYKGLL